MTQSREPSDPAKPLGASSGSDSGFDFVRAENALPPLSAAAVERLEQLVADVVETAVASRPHGPDEQRLIEAIAHMGQREFVATAAISARVLDRRFRSMNSQFASKGPMAKRLAELRKAADELDPTRIKLGRGHSRVDEMKELDRYFARFAKTQPRLESLLAELGQSRFALDRDSASIEAEEASLAREMQALREHVFLAERLDGALTSRLDRMARTDPERAEHLRTQILSVLRRRRQEILTQLAIATQGYAALFVVQESNAEVMAAVASAIETTGAAMHTAVLAAQAAASQRLVLGHLEAAEKARGAMANQASALEAGIAVRDRQTEALNEAWSQMRAALDRVDEQKVRALRSISSADRELTRPKP